MLHLNHPGDDGIGVRILVMVLVAVALIYLMAVL